MGTCTGTGRVRVRVREHGYGYETTGTDIVTGAMDTSIGDTPSIARGRESYRFTPYCVS